MEKTCEFVFSGLRPNDIMIVISERLMDDTGRLYIHTMSRLRTVLHVLLLLGSLTQMCI